VVALKCGLKLIEMKMVNFDHALKFKPQISLRRALPLLFFYFLSKNRNNRAPDTPHWHINHESHILSTTHETHGLENTHVQHGETKNLKRHVTSTELLVALFQETIFCNVDKG